MKDLLIKWISEAPEDKVRVIYSFVKALLGK